MDPSTATVTPLRQRMLDDMRMRKLEPKTQAAYLRAVRKLAAFLERSPDTATAEDLRRFQLHLVDRRHLARSRSTPRITGLKFFFDVTLDRARADGQDAAGARAAHAARRAQSRGGRAASSPRPAT